MIKNLLSCTLLGLTMACGASPATDDGGPIAGWPAYGGSPGGGHYSRAQQITPANVAALERAWVYEVPDFRGKGEMMVQTAEGEIPSMPSGLQTSPRSGP